MSPTIAPKAATAITIQILSQSVVAAINAATIKAVSPGSGTAMLSNAIIAARAQ